jgi:hypothetical protein
MIANVERYSQTGGGFAPATPSKPKQNLPMKAKTKAQYALPLVGSASQRRMRKSLPELLLAR